MTPSKCLGLKLALYALVSVVLSCFVVSVDTVWKLFVAHPLFMMAAFLVCMAEGITAYRMPSKLGVFDAALATVPAPSRLEPIAAVRLRHRKINIIAACLALAGAGAIVLNKLKIKHAVMPHTPHALLGTATLALVAMQCMVGMYKLHKVTNHAAKVHRWHGKAGLVVYTLAAITMVLGMAEIASPATTGLALVALAGSVALVAYIVLREPRIAEDRVYRQVQRTATSSPSSPSPSSPSSPQQQPQEDGQQGTIEMTTM